MQKKKFSLRELILILAILGIAISLYLTYAKLTSTPIICTMSCDSVQKSPYSEIFGIPVAVFGVLYYFVLFFLVQKNIRNYTGLWLVWGILFSSYLTYLELFVIEAICEWCVSSFLNIIVISALFVKLKGAGNLQT